MDHQTTDTKGIYAGLSPADFAMWIRRPSLGEKLKSTAALADAAIRNDRPAANRTNTIKA